MSKKITIIIVFLLALVSVSPAYASQRFEDVPSSHGAYEEIAYLVNLGVIKGYTEKGKTAFKPNASVTRGQAAKMVVVATKNKPVVVKKSSFSDVTVGTELSGYVESAIKLGFFSDYSKGKFGPNVPLTRDEMSKVLASAFNLAPEQYAKLAIPFTDVKQTNPFYPYIAAIYYNGITKGDTTGTKYNAKEAVKRSQFASFVARANSDKYRLDLPVQGVHIPDDTSAIAKVSALTNNLNIRASASTKESNVLGKANTGDSFNVFDVQGDWYKVAYNGRYAYVSTDYTTPVDEGGNVLGKVQQQVKAKGDVKIYAARDVGGTVRKTVKDQAVVDVYSTVGNWYSTIVDGLPAYIRISQTGPLQEAPPVEKPPVVETPPAVVEKPPVVTTPQNTVTEEPVQEEPVVEEPAELPPVALEPVDELPAETPPVVPTVNLLTDTIGKATVNGLHIRETASGSSASRGKIDRGTLVEVHSITGSWAKVKVNGIEGYINKTYLQLLNQTGAAVKGRIIVIDPGHGGKDPGAVKSGAKEKEVVFNVAQLLKAKLEQDGAIVKMTRVGDTYPSLQDRVSYAKSQNGEVFVSIHANAATSTSAKGTETFYSKTANDNEKEDYVLASAINREIVANAKMNNRDVRRADYVVVRGLVIPAVLVELGFLSNAEDRKKLTDAAYIEIYAQSIYNGIVQYYTK